VLNGRVISDSIDAGGVAAAILTKNHNIYKGVCIDTACSLGFCAERNAIGSMITNGEEEIEKLVCIGSHNDNIMMPCGACRELIMQLSDTNKKTKILTNLNNNESVSLEELMPKWWK
jgi:cytidine deaminase